MKRASGRLARAITVGGWVLAACVLAAGTLVAAYSLGEPAARATSATDPTATAFGGTRAVGALFQDSGGHLWHFCTAAVVHSPRGDLVITAAHCLTGRKLGPKGDVFFAPGYVSGHFPKGRWKVMSSIVDTKWRKDHNPNDDVAFLVVGKPGQRIERTTGAETVGVEVRLPQTTEVIGYPDATNRPVRCTAPARLLHKPGYRQLVFDCGGFTGGTSGGPFLIHVNGSTGDGEVIGVIGGYQSGGDSPSISYSSRFLLNVAYLYKKATS
jgi:V8-like Glu-specific endopeptidase